MNPRSRIQTPAKSFFTPVQTGILQRKCASCGQHAIAGGACDQCAKKRPPESTTADALQLSQDFSQIPVNATRFSVLQPQLMVGQSGDRYEQEADRVAEQVMQMSEPSLQPQFKKAQPARNFLQAKPFVQSQAATGQLRAVVPPVVNKVLRSYGHPLDSGTRNSMEARFGHDFSQVRIHTGSEASASAAALNARAYTVGNNVVFGAGQFQPQTSTGQRLLAHELTHTIQQFSGIPTIQRDLAIEPQGNRPERQLSAVDITGAIDFNRRMFTDPYSLAVIRDVIGISKYPAVSDEALALGVARWQADQGIAQDGKVGGVTLMFILEELQAEGETRDAQLLRADFQGQRSRIPDIDTSHCGCRAEIEAEIADSQSFIPVYQQCGADPSIITGDQVEACVDQHFAGQGVSLTTAGTTSSSGAISVAPQAGPCGPLLEQITRAHEQIHSVHTEELRQQHGSGAAFNQAFTSAQDWVADEVNSRQTDIATARFMLEVLDDVCPTGSSTP